MLIPITKIDFIEAIEEEYFALADIAYSIDFIDDYELAADFFLGVERGIAFTGCNGKQLHGPTLAAAITRALTGDVLQAHGRRILTDLLHFWTEEQADTGLVVAFPTITAESFAPEDD